MSYPGRPSFLGELLRLSVTIKNYSMKSAEYFYFDYVSVVAFFLT